MGASHSKLPYPTKFGADRHCVSGDIMGLVCHVISQDYVMKGLDEFMGESPSS